MHTPSPLTGLFTAMITPFRDGMVDEKALEAFVDWQIEQGVHGLVPCGTTGESPTLSHEEHKRVVEITIKVAAGRVPVMAGTGSNATKEAVMLSEHAAQAGADALLVVVPYYNKPSEAGLKAHFLAIAEAAQKPVFVYNIPGRSVLNLSDAFLAELAEIPHIAGVKDATGDLARVSSLRSLVGSDFILLSGEDITAPGFNAQGGQGCISVTSNIAPKLCAQMQTHCLNNQYHEALAINDRLVPLHQALFAETNPIGVKHAAGLMGLCQAEIRLPLCAPGEAVQQRLQEAMQTLSLI